jgi:hypothetical protein
MLGRSIHEYTSATGYAGGKSADKEGRVCYHNMQSVADYGKLGKRLFIDKRNNNDNNNDINTW